LADVTGTSSDRYSSKEALVDRPIRIGVQLWPGGAPSYAQWRQAVLDVEELGVDVIFGYDHFYKPALQIIEGGPQLFPEQPDVNNFEGWTALSSWGEITTTAEIGLLVTGIGYRNPDLLADMARTVDHISGGRLILGLGAGWYQKDYDVYGYEFGTVGSRMALFAEGLERIRHRLGQLLPQPVRDIPILIGGSGERKTIPLVGKYADIWHTFGDPETFERKNALVAQHASGAGRDDRLIERSVAWTGTETADQFADQGVTLFTIEIRPTDAGFDLAPISELLTWREQRR
jgi:probable F420-dependent oxidoreductase